VSFLFHSRPHAAAARAALVSILLITAGTDARAGTIGFKTDAKVTAGPGIDAEVTLTHTGDEMASDVRVEAELLGKTVDGEKVPAIAPGQNHVWKFHMADQIARGSYAIVLRAHYSDANGYEFEIISTAVAPVGISPAPKIFGSLDVPSLAVGGQATATLNLKKPSERSGSFEVRLVAPSGFDVTPDHVTLDFASGDKTSTQFHVRNKDLLAGTSVNLFAFVTGNDAGFPQTDTIRGMARITAAKVKVTSRQFYYAAAALAALLVLLEGLWLAGVISRHRETA